MKTRDNPMCPIFTYFVENCLNKKEVQFFTTNYEKIHRFFYDAKLKYPEIFKEMNFNTNGHFPFSKDIDEDLFILKSAGLLVSISPQERLYLLSKRFPEKFPGSENNQSELKTLANNFYNELGCDEKGNIGKHTKFNGLEKIV